MPHKQLSQKLNELIDAFQNLKDYCLYNNIGLLASCENLLQEARNTKEELDQKETNQIPISLLQEKINALAHAFDKLRKEFA